MSADERRPCFGCGHIHADGPGACWEAACAPQCTELPTCPQPYRPDGVAQ